MRQYQTVVGNSVQNMIAKRSKPGASGTAERTRKQRQTKPRSKHGNYPQHRAKLINRLIGRKLADLEYPPGPIGTKGEESSRGAPQHRSQRAALGTAEHRQPGEDVLSKTEKKEKRMSYSVETPYGFHIDLDFLKYVHDIEKGNTIKRIHIHRRAKQSKFSTLPRNFSVPDNGSQSYGSSSSKTWSPSSYKTDTTDGNLSASGSSIRLKYIQELNYRRKDNVFDTHKMEQLSPEEFSRYTGRPQFVRASSMPAALPQSTMSSDQNQYLQIPQSINSVSESRLEYLDKSYHTASDDHITAALKRIKDLEDQLKSIKELKQTIKVLEGENSQVHAQLKSISQMLCSNEMEQENVELTILESDSKAEAIPIGNGESDIYGQLSGAALNNSTFLAIKQQVIDLKEQLNNSTIECQNLRVLVERQNNEIKAKDIHIAELTNMINRMEEVMNTRQREDVEYSDVAVNTEELQTKEQKETCDQSTFVNISVDIQSAGCGDKAIGFIENLDEKGESIVMIDSDDTGDRTDLIVQTNITLDLSDQNLLTSDLKTEEAMDSGVSIEHGSLETDGHQTHIDESKACSSKGDVAEAEHCSSEEQAQTDASIGQYVKRIQELLQEQWTYLETGYPDLASAIKQPASKLSSIQTQLVNSLNLLSSVYSTQTASDRDGSKTKSQQRETGPRSSLKSIMKKKTSNCRSGGNETQAKKNLQFVGVNGGYETTSSEDSSSSEEFCGSNSEQADTSIPTHSQASTDDQTDSASIPDPENKEKESQETPHSTSSSDTQTNLQRCTVGDVFHNECQILSSHLSELRTTTDNQLRQTLYNVCQEWFRVSSQKSSSPDLVAVYLEEFRSISPRLLQTVVNIADENGNTALHYSVSHSNFRIVKLLLETGVCDVDHQNKAGYTPVMLTPLASAETDEDMEVVLTLLNHGNVNLCATQGGQTALMLGVSHGRSDMVNVLLNCGADVNLQDEDGESALMIACQLGNVEIVKLLLAQPECDTELTDKSGNSALSIVANSAHSEITELLQAHTEHRPSSPATEMEKGASL
ncbi:KN motif and ankyrin repeat domain-containing protein 4 [Rhinophrynus dorsalis]